MQPFLVGSVAFFINSHAPNSATKIPWVLCQYFVHIICSATSSKVSQKQIAKANVPWFAAYTILFPRTHSRILPYSTHIHCLCSTHIHNHNYTFFQAQVQQVPPLLLPLLRPASAPLPTNTRTPTPTPESTPTSTPTFLPVLACTVNPATLRSASAQACLSCIHSVLQIHSLVNTHTSSPPCTHSRGLPHSDLPLQAGVPHWDSAAACRLRERSTCKHCWRHRSACVQQREHMGHL